MLRARLPSLHPAAAGTPSAPTHTSLRTAAVQASTDRLDDPHPNRHPSLGLLVDRPPPSRPADISLPDISELPELLPASSAPSAISRRSRHRPAPAVAAPADPQDAQRAAHALDDALNAALVCFLDQSQAVDPSISDADASPPHPPPRRILPARLASPTRGYETPAELASEAASVAAYDSIYFSGRNNLGDLTVREEEQLGNATHRALWALALYREEVFALRNELCLVDAGQWATAKAAFESHLVSYTVYTDVLCAAAHASFSHAEYAIAEYLDAEGLGEGEGEGEDDAEDTDMQDANFVHDIRRSTDE